jgi:hypothetical protein
MDLQENYHKFNDDLLSTVEDLDLAARKYPTVLHVLDHPELRDLFEKIDASANHAKRKGRTFGLLAIGLGLTALMMAAFEHLLHPAEGPASFVDRVREWPTALALVAAGCGLASVLIGGMGVLYAEKKRRWLCQRLITERIRQFHFQTFVCRQVEIMKSLKNEETRAAYCLNRSLWFEEFKAKFAGKLDVEFAETVDEQGGAHVWLHGVPIEPELTHDIKGLDPLFAAYRELRIEHQIRYASYKLADDHRLLSSEPRGQAAMLWNISFASILALCAIHVVVLLVVLLAPSEWSRVNAMIGMVAVLTALVALAARAIEQGLQPEREVERYQQYRAALRAVLERFDLAESQTEKLAIMREMERVSFDEMRNFLITNERSRFVM